MVITFLMGVVVAVGWLLRVRMLCPVASDGVTIVKMVEVADVTFVLI